MKRKCEQNDGYLCQTMQQFHHNMGNQYLINNLTKVILSTLLRRILPLANNSCRFSPSSPRNCQP